MAQFGYGNPRKEFQAPHKERPCVTKWLQQGLDIGLGLKRGEIGRALPRSDPFDGDPQGCLNGQNDAARGASINLGQDDPRERGGFCKHLGLR